MPAQTPVNAPESGPLEISRGVPGCLLVFGLVPVAIGLFGLYLMLVEPERVTTAGRVVLLPLIALGLPLLFRKGTTTDPGKAEVVSWWGLGVPSLPPLRLSRTHHRLNRLVEIRLDTVSTAREDSRQAYTHRLRLAGEVGDPVELERETSFETARRRAEELAKRLHLPLRDETRADGVVRAPQDLDRGVRDDGALPEATAPAGMKSRLELPTDGLVIHIPPTGIRPHHVAVPFIWGLGVAAFLYFEGSEWTVLEAGFVAVAVLAAVIAMAYDARRHWRVEATWEQLRIQQRGLLRKTTTLAASEVEELFAKGGRIEARTDRAQVQFGRDLASDEAEYLVSAIRGTWARLKAVKG